MNQYEAGIQVLFQAESEEAAIQRVAALTALLGTCGFVLAADPQCDPTLYQEDSFPEDETDIPPELQALLEQPAAAPGSGAPSDLDDLLDFANPRRYSAGRRAAR